ncbi:hypothetical protein K402DRAFT_402843 [Aulographum hederae CBS 113979]|uniref:Uncharacterized protein n=1 Tax=Aulographum hederae CBS 113979 TaxID=1176131 RepID=A0A6G1H6I7_9PEZI|nr:hypothetical protein K402DRAFT_402843 [Aulographum hederae CBS 113979]
MSSDSVPSSTLTTRRSSTRTSSSSTSETTCTWPGHCLGDSCVTSDDCDHLWVCSNRACAVECTEDCASLTSSARPSSTRAPSASPTPSTPTTRTSAPRSSPSLASSTTGATTGAETAAAAPAESHSGIPTGTAIGVGIAIPLAVILLALLAFFFWRRNRRKNARSDDSALAKDNPGSAGGRETISRKELEAIPIHEKGIDEGSAHQMEIDTQPRPVELDAGGAQANSTDNKLLMMDAPQITELDAIETESRPSTPRKRLPISTAFEKQTSSPGSPPQFSPLSPMSDGPSDRKISKDESMLVSPTSEGGRLFCASVEGSVM